MKFKASEMETCQRVASTLNFTCCGCRQVIPNGTVFTRFGQKDGTVTWAFHDDCVPTDKS